MHIVPIVAALHALIILDPLFYTQLSSQFCKWTN